MSPTVWMELTMFAITEGRINAYKSDNGKMSCVQPKHMRASWIDNCRDIEIKWVKWWVYHQLVWFTFQEATQQSWDTRRVTRKSKETCMHLPAWKLTPINNLLTTKHAGRQGNMNSKEWHMWKNRNAKWQILGIWYNNKPAVPGEFQQGGHASVRCNNCGSGES